MNGTDCDLLVIGLRLKFCPETMNIYVQRVVFHVGQVPPRRLNQVSRVVTRPLRRMSSSSRSNCFRVR